MLFSQSQHNIAFKGWAPKINLTEKVKRNAFSELSSFCEQILVSLTTSSKPKCQQIVEYSKSRGRQKDQNQQTILIKIKSLMTQNQKGYVPLELLLECEKIKSIMQELIPLNETCPGLSRQQLAIGLLRSSILEHSKKCWVNYRSVRLLNRDKMVFGESQKLAKKQEEYSEQDDKDHEEDNEQQNIEHSESYELIQSVKKMQINPYINHQTSPKLTDPMWSNLLDHDNSSFFI